MRRRSCFVMEDLEERERARLHAMREQAQGVSQSADPIPDNSTAKLANSFEDAAPTSDVLLNSFLNFVERLQFSYNCSCINQESSVSMKQCVLKNVQQHFGEFC